MYLKNSSNKHLVAKLKAENTELNKAYKLQVNKNINIVKLCKWSKKYRLAVDKVSCQNKEITGLNKVVLESNVKQCKIDFLKKEYDSLKARCKQAEAKVKSMCEAHLKYILQISK